MKAPLCQGAKNAADFRKSFALRSLPCYNQVSYTERQLIGMYPEKFSLTDVERYATEGVFSESFRFPLKSDCGQCMVVTANSRYEGEAAPQIRFFLIDEKDTEKPIYESFWYTIGRNDCPTRQQWRVPPMFHPALHAEIEVQIPEGTKLYLTDFHNHYADPGRWNDVGVRFNAHLGYKIAPLNTRLAVELAAQCGFSTCIINPKEIADGEIICMHDPRLVKYARDAQGNKVDDNRLIFEMTYPEIARWDYGLRRSEIFRGQGILKLEDYFKICTKTGMKPMFSAHEDALRITGWLRIKEMLQKYGLTRYLHVKAPCMDVLELAFEAFGDSIDGYTLDQYAPELMKNSSLNGANCRLVIESWFENYKSRDDVQHILDSGFTAAAFGFNMSNTKSMDVYRKLMDWGVSEFTEDYHCSLGLNW